jgi:hypothetical protein
MGGDGDYFFHGLVYADLIFAVWVRRFAWTNNAVLKFGRAELFALR